MVTAPRNILLCDRQIFIKTEWHFQTTPHIRTCGETFRFRLEPGVVDSHMKQTGMLVVSLRGVNF